MKIRTNYTFIQIASPCFRDFPRIWNVASVRDDISLRKWSGGTAGLRSLVEALVAKNAFVGSSASFSHLFLCT